MPWFPLSDELYRDPRFAGLTGDALALWTRAASWCADRLTDGFVPSTMLATFNGAAVSHAVELVDAGAWNRARGGYQFADWPAFVTKAKVEAKRAADNKRQERHRTSKGVPSRRDTRRDSRSESQRDSPATRTLPKSYSVPNGTGGEGAPSITVQTVVGAWVDAVNGTGTAKPTGAMKAQVGREARELLADAVDPTLVLDSAKAVGARGYATLHREVVAAQRRNVRPIRPLPPGYDPDGIMRDPRTGVAIER